MNTVPGLPCAIRESPGHGTALASVWEHGAFPVPWNPFHHLDLPPDSMTARLPRLFGVLALLAFAVPALAQSPVGTWRTIDDETGQPKSVVRVTQNSDGTLTGTIVRLLPEGRTCSDCVDRYPNDGPVASMRGRALKNQNLQGLVILSGFQDRDGDGKWEDGLAFNPADGKKYRGWLRVERDGRLRLTGGYKILGRIIGKTQYWERVR